MEIWLVTSIATAFPKSGLAYTHSSTCGDGLTGEESGPAGFRVSGDSSQSPFAFMFQSGQPPAL